MSSSSTAIAIPKRKGKGPASSHHHDSSSSSSSFAASTPSTPNTYNYNFTPSPNRFSYGSAGGSYGSTPSSSSSGSPQSGASSMRRRESLMSETFSRQEHTVINVGEEEEGLRLITCVKASQGFDWNQEMFLPSYVDYHFDDLERRQDPVQDIIITDEEVRNMFPS
ncbi:hypothetical protein BKA58DRAFT_67962 [Alternaria rosae]|uniref:uncharacterized protein n=1 Tax=Alternaria rosae TaxID=1187941 RepID=UPI001E8E0782|nr:uncharacterized protein BKA58DRAFT_67962 [Alternaria rosae]KAH6851399.1 hypothetical protein BKA58DRAFT_67962 [Alternaria rosae]